VKVFFPFMILAACGFVVSAGVHVASLIGLPTPEGAVFFLLHGGVFIVFVPAMVVWMTVMLRTLPRLNALKVATLGLPKWMRWTVVALFAYAYLNMTTLFDASSHGTTPSPLAHRTIARIFSGGWMLFYATAFSILYSVSRRPDLLRARRCSNMHRVTAADEFCPRCGEALVATTGA